MKKKILALLCSVLVLVSVFALTCAAKPNDVDNVVIEPSNQAEIIGIGDVVYLGTCVTNCYYNHIRYYNCLVNGNFIENGVLSYNELALNYEGVEVTNYSPQTNKGDLVYTFSYTYMNDGGEYDYQNALHANGEKFHTIKYKVTFYNNNFDSEIRTHNISYVETISTDEASHHTICQGFKINKVGVFPYRIDVEFYDYEESTMYPLPISMTYRDTITVYGEDFDESKVYLKGYDNGHLDGYAKGYTDGCSASEEWSFRGLVSAIINAPLEFVSNALNFEVFGVNVANTVKVLITLSLLAIVITFLFKLGGKR